VSDFRGVEATRYATPSILESREWARIKQRCDHQSACFSQSDGRFFELSGEVNIDSGKEHRSPGKTRPGGLLAAAPEGD